MVFYLMWVLGGDCIVKIVVGIFVEWYLMWILVGFIVVFVLFVLFGGESI